MAETKEDWLKANPPAEFGTARAYEAIPTQT
jgi:hypothetical protein